jgi:hypothetical protein
MLQTPLPRIFERLLSITYHKLRHQQRTSLIAEALTLYWHNKTSRWGTPKSLEEIKALNELQCAIVILLYVVITDSKWCLEHI